MTKEITKDDIIATLPKLNPIDLAEVIAVAIHLHNREGDDSTAEKWFDAICMSLGSSHAYNTVKKGSIGTLLRDQCDQAEKLLETLLSDKTRNEVGRRAIRKALMDLTVEFLKKRNLPPTRGMLAKNLSRITDVVDDAFPDYRKGGLGPTIGDRLAGV